MWWIVGGLLSLITCMLYCCLVVAGQYDKEMEKYLKGK